MTHRDMDSGLKLEKLLTTLLMEDDSLSDISESALRHLSAT